MFTYTHVYSRDHIDHVTQIYSPHKAVARFWLRSGAWLRKRGPFMRAPKVRSRSRGVQGHAPPSPRKFWNTQKLCLPGWPPSLKGGLWAPPPPLATALSLNCVAQECLPPFPFCSPIYIAQPAACYESPKPCIGELLYAPASFFTLSIWPIARQHLSTHAFLLYPRPGSHPAF